MPKVIHIPPIEKWNESKQEFEYPIGTNGIDITIEHSLISIYKWEARWHKPFLTSEKHTNEEVIDYVKCMTVTQNVKDEVYDYITEEAMKEITDYIDDPMTATTFSKENAAGDKRKSLREEKITAELVYYWMITFHIPFECRKWHFEQLMTLIEVCSRKTDEANKRSEGKGKRGMKAPKMSSSTIANRQRLNEQRLKAYGGQ